MTLETILAVLAGLVGWPALVALVIDVLKNFNVVTDDNAGKWNLGFQLVGFGGVAVILGFFPTFDLKGFDAVLLNYVTIAAYVIGLLLQMGAAKFFHSLYKKAFGQKVSWSLWWANNDPDF